MDEKWMVCWKIWDFSQSILISTFWMRDVDAPFHFFQENGAHFLQTLNKHNELSNQWPCIVSGSHLNMIDVPEIVSGIWIDELVIMSFSKTMSTQNPIPKMWIWIRQPAGECACIRIKKEKIGWMREVCGYGYNNLWACSLGWSPFTTSKSCSQVTVRTGRGYSIHSRNMILLPLSSSCVNRNILLMKLVSTARGINRASFLKQI